MKKLIVFFVILIITTISSTIFAMDNTDILLNIKQYSKDIILNDTQIKNLNENIIDIIPSVINIFDLGTSLKKDTIKKYIKNISIKSAYPRYSINKTLLSDNYYSNLYNNMNLSKLKEDNILKFGIIISRSSLKKFPTSDCAFSSTTSSYDRFLETTLYVGEPIVILQESADSKFYFVAMYNYMGWVNKDNIALCNRDLLKMYVSCPNFITITANNTLSMKNNIQLDLGSKIPLLSVDVNYNLVGLIPAKRNDGSLYFIRDSIYRIDCYKGYMNYSTRNLIKITTKLIGEPYGWGGSNNARDCSSYVMDVFRVFGINFPRNTNEQENIPAYTKKIISINDFDTLDIGTLLFMDNHVMIYLGTYNNIQYIIHDTPGYFINKKYIDKNGVTISPLNIYSSKNISYKKLIYKAITIK